jgi:hypothetical protein
MENLLSTPTFAAKALLSTKPWVTLNQFFLSRAKIYRKELCRRHQERN